MLLNLKMITGNNNKKEISGPAFLKESLDKKKRFLFLTTLPLFTTYIIVLLIITISVVIVIVISLLTTIWL